MANHNSGFSFQDRSEAGLILAHRLKSSYATLEDVVVLALPRGGVPVGVEIARALKAPLATFLVRKLGVPGHKELAMGAITSGGAPTIDPAVTEKLHLSDRLVQSVVRRETQRLEHSQILYSSGRKSPDLNGKIVILADDGATTGTTLAFAVQTIRQQGAAEVIVAVPVATPGAVSLVSQSADEVVCLMQPKTFIHVSRWYQKQEDFTDRQICDMLEHSADEWSQRKIA